jgi:Negative regulator of sigma E activity
MKTLANLGLITIVLTLVLAAGACQRAPVSESNLNTNLSTNANLTPANSNTATQPIATLAAREPQTYKATLVFTAQTEGGENAIGIPPLSAEVAKNGEDRRVQFKLPDGSDLVYLDHAGTAYAIAPARKQYAELTPAATGFQLHKMMTPGQLVSYLDRLQGIAQIGEEPVNGRPALKYRYARTSNTNTSAGQVNTESYIFIDKDTGLPLRAELFSEATGNVQGVKGAKIVAEMRDITTNVDPGYFEVPAGLNKVSEAQVRQQVDAVTNTVAAVLRTLLTNMNTAPPPPSPTTSPTASPTP